MKEGKSILLSFIFCFLAFAEIALAQETEQPEHEKKAQIQVFKGNEQMLEGQVLDGEKSYRKALISDPNNLEAKYNLGVSNYKTKNFQEAVERNKQAVKDAKERGEKHIAYHNLGNSYLQMQQPDEAIEAYKNALRNNPTDDETRYNLAVARQMKEQQDQQQNQDQNQDQQNQDQNNKDQDDSENGEDQENDQEKEGEEDQENKDKEDKGENEDEQEGDEEKEPKDQNNGESGDEEKEEPAQPKEGQLSPEQVQSLLEAMAEEEKKVQEKMSEEKTRGVKVKSDKDW